jgi:hypothetical protein
MARNRTTAIAGKPCSHEELVKLWELSLLAMGALRSIKVHGLPLPPSTGALRCNETLAPYRSQ